MAGYASYPTPLVLDDRVVRIFFSPRDSENRSSITSLDLNLEGEHFQILTLPQERLLSPGQRGSFDDSGVTVACVIPVGSEIFVYYLGWNLGTTVPFRNFIGLAVGDRNASQLHRLSPAPILDRSAIDPYSLSYPWVLRGPAAWRMWYGSHLAWDETGPGMQHVIKEASSEDGIHWRRDGKTTVSLAGKGEYAVTRPSVLPDADRGRMWFARRSSRSEVGYAELVGGEWQRQDNVLRFKGVVDDWESEGVNYPAVFDHGGRRYMLYNGDGYGRTGFGIAILEAGI
jgi:hypothetical protein